MRKLLIIFLLIPLPLFAPGNRTVFFLKESFRDEALLRAIIQVESQGNPDATNWKENALGLIQIREVMLDEVNRILTLQGSNKRYIHADCLDSLKSIQIFWIIQDYWNPTGDYYKGARLWNGRSKKNIYWNKIKKLV